MTLALEKARLFLGATAPNPPVGAVGLDASGNVLSVQAHEKAGTPHAEVRVIEDCRKRGTLPQLHTVVVTLEPCNHFGKTPPCTQALIQAGVKRVVFGARDPNPKVVGQGAEALRKAGIEVVEGVLHKDCEELICAFTCWVRTGRPWVTLKRALQPDGSMIPPEGQKTFTSPESLKLAHELRKRADAILTGSSTVLADSPEFTVRHVPDHPGKRRWLVVLDRRGRTPESWIKASESRGFQVTVQNSLESALDFLGSQGVLEVLVEAGPTLSQAVLSASLWDEDVVITRGKQSGENPDKIYVHRNHSKSRSGDRS